MRGVIPRALVLACGVLLVLPPGWCCLLARGACCGHRPVVESASRKGCPCAAKEGTSSSCCCREKSNPPRQTPIPANSRCCVRDLTVAKIERPAGDAALVGPADLCASVTDSTASNLTPISPAAPSSPPLHLLHCVWLC